MAGISITAHHYCGHQRKSILLLTISLACCCLSALYLLISSEQPDNVRYSSISSDSNGFRELRVHDRELRAQAQRRQQRLADNQQIELRAQAQRRQQRLDDNQLFSTQVHEAATKKWHDPKYISNPFHHRTPQLL